MNLIRHAFNMIWLMEILRDKAFNIAKNPKYDAYKGGLASVVYTFFDKKSPSLTDISVSGGGVANNEIKQNFQLAEKLLSPLLENLKKEKFILDLKKIFGVLI